MPGPNDPALPRFHPLKGGAVPRSFLTPTELSAQVLLIAHPCLMGELLDSPGGLRYGTVSHAWGMSVRVPGTVCGTGFQVGA